MITLDLLKSSSIRKETAKYLLLQLILTPSKLYQQEVHFYRNILYVKVYGTIRVFKEEKAIVGTHIKRVDKFDEVTNHLLQTFVAQQLRKKGVLTSAELKPSAQGNANASLTNIAQQSGDYKQMVLAVMKEMNKNTRFISKTDIFTMVRNKMTEKDVEKVLIQLCEDGAIHSGYDNDVYSITE